MNFKQFLKKTLDYSSLNNEDIQRISLLESTLLSNLRKSDSSYEHKSIDFSVLFRMPLLYALIILLTVGAFLMIQSHGGQTKKYALNLIPNVSAQELVVSVEQAINSTYLHYTSDITEYQDDQFSSHREVWINREKKKMREESYDKQGRLLGVTVGDLPPHTDPQVYTFIFDTEKRQGKFVRQENTIMDQGIGLRQDFIDGLKNNMIGNNTSVEKIKYNGSPVYKLTLKDRDQKTIVSTYLFDPQTHLPIEETDYFPSGQPARKVLFHIDTQTFDEAIFNLVPPKGYTISL